MILPTQMEKARKLRELHEGPRAFVIPNPWDAGSARLLQGMGFEALATTSSGFAFTLGREDGQVTLEEAVTHCSALSAVTRIPLSADLENGFADAPAEAARAIARAASAGAVGGSIEDWSGASIYDFDLAVERVHAAVETARSLEFPFSLTARAENLIRGRHDLEDTIRRLQAFEAAGADVLYAPGLKTLDEVRAVTSSLSKPVNVLATLVAGASGAELEAAGARRLSIGGALTAAALAPVVDAGRQMRDEGSFEWASRAARWSEVKRLFKSLDG